MNEFYFYLKQGINHILDPNGIDHLLFVLAIAIQYAVKDWRRLLTVITAFTLGHSITLALSSLDIVSFSPQLVELLIPITILITCVSNITKLKVTHFHLADKLTYIVVLLFGLIHGLGFSTFFRAMMMDAGGILKPLFSFNLGIELGQLVIVTVLFTVLLGLTSLLKSVKHKYYVLFISLLVGVEAVLLIIDNIIS